MIETLFNIEMLLSIFASTLGLGGFFFTLKHRMYYSVWARSSILMGSITSLAHLYNFEYIRETLMLSEYAIVCIMTQTMFSLSILLFTFTILRFKWKWQVDVHKHCTSSDCPLVMKYK
jgi:predicted transporter